MTRKEAIKALTMERKTALHENKQAFDMAIKALEQEPTTKNDLGVDCISRERVLKLIYDYKENHSNDREHYPINYGTLLDMIRWVMALPPVTPQEPTGKNFTKADIDAIVKAISAHWELIIDEIRAEIIKYEGDCRLSVDEHPSCKQCTDNVFETIYGILDKYKAESEE